MGCNTDFDSVHSKEVIKLMAIGSYNGNEHSSPAENRRGSENFGDSREPHNFVTVIPVEYPRQQFPNSSYSNQNLSSQEDITVNSPFQLNEKGASEISSMASVSTQSSHIVTRGVTNSMLPIEKPNIPRVPNGQVCVFLSNGTCVCVDTENGLHTTAAAILKSLVETEDLNLPPVAADVFALWMVSKELEVQLKAHHKPMKLFTDWPKLVRKYTKMDKNMFPSEPTLNLRRNAFYHKNDEIRLRDSTIIELLYFEAKHNILVGKYPCSDVSEAIFFASLVARINLGNFVPQQHNPYFFRNRLREYLPAYACVKSNPWSLFWPLSKLQRADKTAPESLIVEQLKKLPNNIPSTKLMLNYLKRCWTKPYYGAAFFRGQIEERCTSRIASWFSRGDLEIIIAVSSTGVYLIELKEGVMLLGLKYGDFIWDCAFPCHVDDPECFPCIFLQFASTPSIPRDGNDTCLVQVFSKQALMLNALMTYYTNRRRSSSAVAASSSNSDETDGIHEHDLDDVMVPLTNQAGTEVSDACLTNKLHRLSLATFDDEGNRVSNAHES